MYLKLDEWKIIIEGTQFLCKQLFTTFEVQGGKDLGNETEYIYLPKCTHLKAKLWNRWIVRSIITMHMLHYRASMSQVNLAELPNVSNENDSMSNIMEIFAIELCKWTVILSNNTHYYLRLVRNPWWYSGFGYTEILYLLEVLIYRTVEEHGHTRQFQL